MIRQLAIDDDNEELENGLVALIAASTGGSFCAQKLMYLALNKLVNSIEFVQIIVHLGLVDCNAVARVERYLNKINELVAFEYVKHAEIVMAEVGIEWE